MEIYPDDNSPIPDQNSTQPATEKYVRRVTILYIGRWSFIVLVEWRWRWRSWRRRIGLQFVISQKRAAMQWKSPAKTRRRHRHCRITRTTENVFLCFFIAYMAPLCSPNMPGDGPVQGNCPPVKGVGAECSPLNPSNLPSVKVNRWKIAVCQEVKVPSH